MLCSALSPPPKSWKNTKYDDSTPFAPATAEPPFPRQRLPRVAYPLVSAPHVQQALVHSRVYAELRALVVDEEGLLGDSPRVRARAQKVDGLDLGQEVVVQGLRDTRPRRARWEGEAGG